MLFKGIKNIDDLLDKAAIDSNTYLEMHRYDFQPKTQELPAQQTPSKDSFPPSKELKIEYNDSLNPTTQPTEKLENNDHGSNTTFAKNPGSDQLDMQHPNKSASKKLIP